MVTINGNTQYRKGLEDAVQLNHKNTLRFEFTGVCDEKAGQILEVVHGLHRRKVDFDIRLEDGRVFKYDPKHDKSNLPHDCYELIGSKSGLAFHPQEVVEITAYSKKN